MNTASFKPIIIIIIIPYNKNCNFFTNVKNLHSMPHTPKSPSQTNPKRSDQVVVEESLSDPVLSVPNCSPVNLLALSSGNH